METLLAETRVIFQLCCNQSTFRIIGVFLAQISEFE